MNNLEQINALAAEDMQAVNKMLHEKLHSNVSLIKKLSFYILNGGKRLRPMITILCARAINYKGLEHITIATLIEFIHTATLLHDDVVDHSYMRRGKKTANIKYGNAASVLVGDFIYTRAFQMMIKVGSIRILSLMANAANIISEGEILQLMNCNNSNITEENYMNIIYHKTARLFEVAAQSSAILANANEIQENALKNYGRYIGTAFQLIDDLLDYSSDEKKFGKRLGHDLKEGKLTLPLLHAMHHGNLKQSSMIRKIIEKGNGIKFLEPILEIMHQCGSLEWTLKKAKEETNKAISELKYLPDSPWRYALKLLANAFLERTI